MGKLIDKICSKHCYKSKKDALTKLNELRHAKREVYRWMSPKAENKASGVSDLLLPKMSRMAFDIKK